MGIANVIGFCENTAVAPVDQPAVGDAGFTGAAGVTPMLILLQSKAPPNNKTILHL